MTKLTAFCRSDLFLALLGGFVLGTGIVVSGALQGDAQLPVAAPVVLASSAN